jgi:hypothetical protein
MFRSYPLLDTHTHTLQPLVTLNFSYSYVHLIQYHNIFTCLNGHIVIDVQYLEGLYR